VAGLHRDDEDEEDAESRAEAAEYLLVLRDAVQFRLRRAIREVALLEFGLEGAYPLKDGGLLLRGRPRAFRGGFRRLVEGALEPVDPLVEFGEFRGVAAPGVLDPETRLRELRDERGRLPARLVALRGGAFEIRAGAARLAKLFPEPFDLGAGFRVRAAGGLPSVGLPRPARLREKRLLLAQLLLEPLDSLERILVFGRRLRGSGLERGDERLLLFQRRGEAGELVLRLRLRLLQARLEKGDLGLLILDLLEQAVGDGVAAPVAGGTFRVALEGEHLLLLGREEKAELLDDRFLVLH